MSAHLGVALNWAWRQAIGNERICGVLGLTVSGLYMPESLSSPFWAVNAACALNLDGLFAKSSPGNSIQL